MMLFGSGINSELANCVANEASGRQPTVSTVPLSVQTYQHLHQPESLISNHNHSALWFRIYPQESTQIVCLVLKIFPGNACCISLQKQPTYNLNQTSCFISRSRLFYGQCSEICGANHRFIPIVLERIRIPGSLGVVRETPKLNQRRWEANCKRCSLKPHKGNLHPPPMKEAS